MALGLQRLNLRRQAGLNEAPDKPAFGVGGGGCACARARARAHRGV